MNCAICNDTGKRHGSDYLDCSCAAATARRELQLAITAFIAEYPLGGDLNSDLHWFIHQRATRLAEAEMQAMAQEYKAQIDDLDQQNTALTNDNRGMAAERELHMARIDELERQLLKALGTPENDWCPECHLRESTTDPKDKRIAELEQQLSMAAQAPVREVPEGWIACSERLPALYQTVALLNENRWMNTGNDEFDTNWHGAGWLSEFGHQFWSVIGETRAMTLDFVTHWMPLPAAPVQQEGE